MADEPNLSKEISNLREEALLPVEKRLILWSVGLGILLLGVLVWVSRT
jgi:hypothetical protein